MSTSTVARRVTAALGAIALAAGAAIVAAAPAQAVTLPGNIDPDQPRSLTVHKYALGPSSPQQVGTGQELPAGTNLGQPLPGAVFTAQLTDVDITSAAGWGIASNLTPSTVGPRLTPTTFTSSASAADGTATFPTTMPVGLYLVTETTLPDLATNPTAPFLVTLPLPTGSAGAPANQWIYDVHVYPKNAVTELTKTRVVPAANSPEARNPDLIRWAIASTVPTLAGGDTMTAFTLEDVIPAELVYVQEGSASPTTALPVGVAPTNVVITNASGVNVTNTFIAGTDYSVAYNAATGTATLTFSGTGLGKLAGIQGGLVSFNVLTRAVDIPADGTIENTANATINGATETVIGTTPIGQLTVLAYTTTNTTTRVPLAGAVYNVYLNQNDANLQQNPISIAGQTNWTTGANGLVEIPIITPGNYYVREITPPAGYSLPGSNPVQTAVVAGETSTVPPVQNYIEFAHVQLGAANFLLPLTGGDGGVWFGVGGGALLVIALGAAIVVSRRRAAAARTTA